MHLDNDGTSKVSVMYHFAFILSSQGESSARYLVYLLLFLTSPPKYLWLSSQLYPFPSSFFRNKDTGIKPTVSPPSCARQNIKNCVTKAGRKNKNLIRLSSDRLPPRPPIQFMSVRFRFDPFDPGPPFVWIFPPK